LTSSKCRRRSRQQSHVGPPPPSGCVAAADASGGAIGADGGSGGRGGVDDDDDDAYDSGDDAMAPAGDAWAGEGEQVLKTGFMRKKGGLRHNWTERWFVLTTSALTYFASRSDTQAKGRIMLRDATLGQVKDKGAIFGRTCCWACTFRDAPMCSNARTRQSKPSGSRRSRARLTQRRRRRSELNRKAAKKTSTESDQSVLH
jgi:hypothetical protein